MAARGGSKGRNLGRFGTIAGLCVALLALDVAGAVAQERRYILRERQPGLLDFLFGAPLPRRDGRAPQRVYRQGADPYDRYDTYRNERRYRRERVREPAEIVPQRPRVRRAQPEPKIIVVDKAADARTVLVVGDFLGSGLAEGLEAAFAADRQIRVAARTHGSSGFVREDVFDWADRIGTIIEEEKPAAVVVMLGSNDRQQMTVEGVKEAKLSTAWTAEYEKRVEALAEAVKAKSVPFLWVGMPSFKPSNMTADMLALNGLYKSAAEEAGGEYVDIWDGFVDEAGAFVQTGPDIAGQPVRLRASDGINLTAAGKRKVAFYVEKPLNRLLGVKGAPLIAALPETAVPAVEKELDLNDITRTQPISLADPELDGATDLLGGDGPVRKNPTRTAVERLVFDGRAADPQPGRADDFMGRRQPSALAAAPDAEPAAAATAAAPPPAPAGGIAR